MDLAWLYGVMREAADSPAFIWRDRSTSYAEILALIERWRERLSETLDGPAQVVAIEGDYSPNTTALMLALVERGAIVVPLSLENASHREQFMGTAEVGSVISLDENDSWGIERRRASVGHPLLQRLRLSGDAGLIVFSSGSTGESKAVVHSFDRLLQKFRTPRRPFRVLTFLMFDHLGGINTLLYALSNAGTIVATRSRTPDEICRLVERHAVELLPASPTFFTLLLLSGAHRRYDLSSLRRVTYGTEVMPETTLRRLREALPDVELQQTYGLSELGVLRSKSKDPASLWVKVGGEGVETKVVDGVLWIRTQSSMLGYLNAPSPFDAEGWMNTQDQVEVDGEYIRILGRRSDIINVGGQKVYPAEVENVLMQMPNILDVLVHSEANAITGRMIVATLVLSTPEDPVELTRRLRAFCRERLPRFKVPAKVVATDRDLFSARYKKLRGLAADRAGA